MTEALLAAVGVAVSPFAVVPAVLLLFSSRPVGCSGGFAAGWGLGVALVTTAAVLLADLLTLPASPPEWASWTRIVLGGTLVGLALFKLRGSRDGAGPPGWVRSLEGATPAGAARIGLLASAANPKVALLAVAGGFTLGAELTGPAREAVAIVLFAAVAASSATAPVLAYVLLGARVLQPLGRVRDWLTEHSTGVMAGVLVVLGVLLVWKGVTAL
jgi:threonine/homoserine/homoserine lactone efflux protein